MGWDHIIRLQRLDIGHSPPDNLWLGIDQVKSPQDGMDLFKA